MQFKTTLEKFEGNLWYFHIKVPSIISTEIKIKGIKRLLCSINKGPFFHCSLMPAGNDVYFININKEIRKKQAIHQGDELSIELTIDKSKYGMPVPQEFTELLNHDPEGDKLFHQLTPGKQRGLIYIIAKPKSTDKRIEKAIIVLDHLKEQHGKLDYKILHEDFKTKKNIL